MCLTELPSYMNHRNTPIVAIRQIVKQWLENDKTFNQLDIQHRYTARSTGILVLKRVHETVDCSVYFYYKFYGDW
jgi:hypothetical protein